MPSTGESIPAVDEAVGRLHGEEAISWDSRSRFGAVGLAYRRLLRRALRPYETRRRAVDESVASALEELCTRVTVEQTGSRGLLPMIWADDHRPPQQPLPLLRELLGADESTRLAAIAGSIEAAVSFGEAQARLLGQLGPAHISERMDRDDLPIPTRYDRQGYFGDDHLSYWLSGLGDALLLEGIAKDRGRPFQRGSRMLDLGCSTGRVLRHFHTGGLELELYGVDVALVHVEWARRHLPAEITIAQASVLPGLPFEDASLDVIFAGSVFTHVSDFEEALLLELRRVLHPDGFALLTVHSERLWDELCSSPELWMRREIVETAHRAEPMWLEPIPDSFFSGPMPAERVILRNVSTDGLDVSQVIHSDRWLRERWGRLFEIERYVRVMHGPHQDGLVLSRRR